MQSGLILLNKKTGITSFDALRDIKRALGTGKVGHTGTLDKFAQGLMLILTGKALKLSRWFSHCDKKYQGRVHFGIETDTLDPEGVQIAQAALPSREEVEKVLNQFKGNIMQEPPVYSAIHVDGKRASRLARSGNAPEMKKRPVTIYNLELITWQPPFADFFIHCSSGTYIRSLARDIALAAGSRAHLSALVRTQIANFFLNDCKINQEGSDIPLVNSITKNITASLGLPRFEVTVQDAQKIFQGKQLESILENKTLITNPLPSSLHFKDEAAVFEGDNLIAMIEQKNNIWKYNCTLL
ncbi:MAG: tRNA pseudouridine(55) synthase TruB [Treponema sp.]|nr:tRNA pseudouridine(55) synthase TruB [Treponema sp.]MCL2251156.1 tRNA pseudouridine(55) synthase TruB [Treponema sp.]